MTRTTGSEEVVVLSLFQCSSNAIRRENPRIKGTRLTKRAKRKWAAFEDDEDHSPFPSTLIFRGKGSLAGPPEKSRNSRTSLEQAKDPNMHTSTRQKHPFAPLEPGSLKPDEALRRANFSEGLFGSSDGNVMGRLQRGDDDYSDDGKKADNSKTIMMGMMVMVTVVVVVVVVFDMRKRTYYSFRVTTRLWRSISLMYTVWLVRIDGRFAGHESYQQVIGSREIWMRNICYR
ncbi:hypothetical protein H072_4562 [Dactylellina haptotyla CBS 200.50]|uniref:Uncharacterized protein n=1 Tax=Dactylellina haptotyla (strain CBS 200.50) TaxID=1284197 RepID=S8AET5_DACHA|nr:hypothetical protein H072_4562 [Dactylellina haptotyla CBS 200.50]